MNRQVGIMITLVLLWVSPRVAAEAVALNQCRRWTLAPLK